MSSNKNARKKLEERYGAECFIEKLHLRKDKEPRKYTGKSQMKKMKQLTYHHIKMKKDGGRATVENGALLSAENHIFFHQQSKEVQGYMNALFQEYKRQVDECRECKLVLVDDLDIPYTIVPMEFSIDERKKGYDRNAKKKEDRELIKEWEDNER